MTFVNAPVVVVNPGVHRLRTDGYLDRMNRFTRLAVALAVCLLNLPIGSRAQDIFEDHPVRHIGPGTMSGRVTALTVDPTDRDIIYAGTASGGLWRSTSSGVDWEPLFDDEDILSIGSVAVGGRLPT